jgi:SAM-dependent methyltransferase
MPDNDPWQLQIFKKTLKKKLKLKHLTAYLRNLTGNDTCLLITCGDNNGALNYFLRQLGGRWTWSEMEDDHIREIEALLKEPVVRLDKSTCALPFPDSHFTYTVVIDTHEHLEDPSSFNLEVARVTKTGGTVVVSVPNGNERMLAVKIKNFVGMTKEVYGHVVIGYEIRELDPMLKKAGIELYASKTYSKFFTEMLELMINFIYVKVLGKRSEAKVESGTIAPTSEEQLASVSKTLKLYSWIYPVFWMVSKLDALLFFNTGYAVVVAARRVAA